VERGRELHISAAPAVDRAERVRLSRCERASAAPASHLRDSLVWKCGKRTSKAVQDKAGKASRRQV
jgi:hypothetical protein